MRIDSFGSTKIENCIIEYHILIEDLVDNCGRFFCENYGIRVISEDSNESSKADIPGITTSSNSIHTLAERLLNNSVLPSTALDIVEDYLLE